MPSHDPRAIANEFIKLNGEKMSQIKLQKLVYLAHGWNLAINGEPLVCGDIEAWDGGPVMRPIWDHLRDYGHNASGDRMAPPNGKPYSADLSAEERAVIQHTWRKYDKYTGVWLSRMTHQPGTPWANTYFGEGRNQPLFNEDIRQHFIRLAHAGRQAAR
ncbi:MAG: SocA family protein [Rhodobacteraceae bacterium]|nr:SocA family protein [Paracoccaceae bacterium]